MVAEATVYVKDRAINISMESTIMNQEYALSVVIPTYNKAAYLELTLESFRYQTVSIQEFEIIVVDDGSTDHTSQVVSDYQKLLPIQYIRQNNSGRSVARNMGIEHAKSQLIVFVDDDMLLPSDFLKAHHIAHRCQRNTVVHGQIFELPFLKFFQDPSKGTLLETEREKMHANPEVLQKFLIQKCDIQNLERVESQKRLSVFERNIAELIEDPNEHPAAGNLKFLCCTGANISMQKALLLKVGSFDSAFGKLWGGEDLELGYRLQQYGADFCYSTKARSFHMTHLRQNYRKHLQESFSLFYNKHKNPTIKMLPQLLLDECKSLHEFCNQIAAVNGRDEVF